jgi:CheY-like chemotaxis protein
LGSPSAREWWSSTAAGFGWSILHPGRDQPSVFPFPTGDPEPAAATSEERASTLTILLVEDNKSDVFIVREILRREGLAAVLQVASDGVQALIALDPDRETTPWDCPDLVLLDLNLPRVSGLEVLEKMRRSERCKGIPVIVVTSSNSPDELAAIRKLDVAGYFQKRADLAEYFQLGKLIVSVLAGRRQ